MTATRIVQGLERSETTGAEAAMVARMGFLEWVLGLDGDATAQTAKAALAEPCLQQATSPARAPLSTTCNRPPALSCDPRGASVFIKTFAFPECLGSKAKRSKKSR